MKKQITPCLWFDGQAKEAALLYCSVFNDSKISAQSPIVTEVEASGQRLILLDGGPMYQPNPSISFYYACESAEELEKIWNAFAEGGEVMVPLDSYSWSERFGWLTDKFGISWQLDLGTLEEVGQKITPSLLFTGKQYGRADEAIAHYSDIFGSITIDSIMRYKGDEAPDEEGKVKHVQLSVNGQKLMLMESADKDFPFTPGVSLTLYCETQAEIDYYWGKFTENGKESRCGWLEDKFGISWQIIPTVLEKIMGDPSKAGKAAQAFMSMKKLNIEQIIQASNS